MNPEVEKLVERLNKQIALGKSTGADGAGKSSHNIYVIAAEAATTLQSLTARIAELEGALSGIADDFMTSEYHHPGYILIPTAKFEQLSAAALAKPRGRS